MKAMKTPVGKKKVSKPTSKTSKMSTMPMAKNGMKMGKMKKGCCN